MGKKRSNERDGGDAGARRARPESVEDRRVILLRHGQSEANCTGEDIPDAVLTDAGKAQAASWRGHIGKFGAEVVLVSPLRRAVQTACLAFDGDSAPLELCRHARELWWDERVNHPGPPGAMRLLLKGLPRGAEVQDIDEALVPSSDDPSDEHASVSRLREVLMSRTESTLAVVCHYGVINALTGRSAVNCEALECVLTGAGKFRVLKHHRSPGGPMTIG
mmetsp:Transcript_6131/g.17496  ORF Transcript_6131/g.17496 Transcript_6131/m.17496 type:complete len:220 (-) Transcript_6131:4-663(-)